MNERRVKLLLFFVMITLATLSCDAEAELCEFTGGKWVPIDYIENRPYSSDSADNECDRNFDQEKYQEWQLHGPLNETDGEDNISDVNNGKASGQDNSAQEGSQPQPADSQPAASQPAPEYAEPEDCNAADLLYIQYGAAEVTDGNYEKTCEYTITFTNNGDQPLRVYYFKHFHYMNGEEGSKWDDYTTLEPGVSYSYDCDREDRKSDGAFSFHYLEKIAPVLATDSCKNSFQNNAKNKEVIAFPLQLYCQ